MGEDEQGPAAEDQGEENAEEESPAVAALKAKDNDRLRELLAAGDVDLAQRGANGWTLLHRAAGQKGDPVATQLLLEAKADVDARDDDGETPLHLAAQEGAESQVRALIGSRADIAAKNKTGETPLHVAVQHIGGKNPMHIVLLMQARADPAACDDEGQDVLAHANLYTNRAQELEQILGLNGAGDRTGGPNAGAFTTKPPEGAARSGDFDTMLRAACSQGKVEVLRQLMELTPDPAAAAGRVMASAAASGNVDVLELLVSVRADPATTVPDESSGATPLAVAADQGAVKVVRWLLSKRADVAAPSRDGASALMAAAMRGSTEAAAAILSAGADVEQQAHGGWTALMVACQNGHVDVARQILDARAQIDPSNADGMTARALATNAGHSEVVKLLDTRVKLSNRRAAKAAAGRGGSARTQEGPAAAVEEDTRDLDKLLADLGEKVPAKPSTKKAKAAPAPVSGPAAVAPPAPLNKAEAKKRAKALRERLSELERQRSAIEAEEAEIRRELASLG